MRASPTPIQDDRANARASEIFAAHRAAWIDAERRLQVHAAAAAAAGDEASSLHARPLLCDARARHEGPRRHPHHPDAHGCGHCCTVARTRAGGGADPRHRTCGRHFPPPLRAPQAAAHPLPLPPPPTRPYVIPASLPSSTWNALRQRWISPDSGATEWKASHVPVATGKWLARVGVAPPFFVRQRSSLATKVLMRLTWSFLI